MSDYTAASGKPLGRKAYGSIGHLPGSRLGSGDHHVPEGQARIACVKPRKHDYVIVQEKLDGSCCSVAKLETGEIVALGRAGWLAQSSKYEQHQRFAAWVRAEHARFAALLEPGQRAVGEWLLQAHGTRYALKHEPFVLFDIITIDPAATANAPLDRMLHENVELNAKRYGFTTPCVLKRGPHGVSVELAMSLLGHQGWHGAVDRVEGAVWRVEREGRVDFLAKYVRPDKVDGCYLPEFEGETPWRAHTSADRREPVWNWLT